MTKYFIMPGHSILHQSEVLAAGTVISEDITSKKNLADMLEQGRIGVYSEHEEVRSKVQSARDNEAALTGTDPASKQAKAKDQASKKPKAKSPWQHNPQGLADRSLAEMQAIIKGQMASQGVVEYDLPATHEEAVSILSADYQD